MLPALESLLPDMGNVLPSVGQHAPISEGISTAQGNTATLINIARLAKKGVYFPLTVITSQAHIIWHPAPLRATLTTLSVITKGITMTKRKLSTVLEEARTIIQVWEQRPESVAQLAQVGYTPDSFAHLRDLYKNACDTKLQHSNTIITLREITASIAKMRSSLEAQVRDLSAIAHMLFDDDMPTASLLGLRPRRKTVLSATGAPMLRVPRTRSLSSLINRASTIYHHAQTSPIAAQALAQVGYPTARLQREERLLTELVAARARQDVARLDARIASSGQGKAFDLLDQWLVRFRAIVWIALRDSPGDLAALGITRRR